MAIDVNLKFSDRTNQLYRVVQNELDTFYKSHFSLVGKYNENILRYLQTVIPWDHLVKVASKLMVK